VRPESGPPTSDAIERGDFCVPQLLCESTVWCNQLCHLEFICLEITRTSKYITRTRALCWSAVRCMVYTTVCVELYVSPTRP
jgi:hypothetical protein